MSEIKKVFLSLIFGIMLLCSLSLASAFIVSTNDTNVNVCTSSTTIINDIVYSDTGGTFSVSISGTAAVSPLQYLILFL